LIGELLNTSKWNSKKKVLQLHLRKSGAKPSMRYQTPTTIKEAVGLLKKERDKAYILAGGTDLLVGMKTGAIEPDLLIDIKRIPSACAIKTTKTGFRIGAAVSCAELGEHKALKKAWPGVVEAANLIGSDQIQGRCTIVGNLCNASPAADSVPALMAAGAKAVIVGPEKRRTVRVEDIATGPGTTCLKKGEVVEAITLPMPAKKTGDAYLRFIPRTEMDIAVVGAGICLTLEEGRIKKARVALGAVAPTAVLVPQAAKAIIGTKLDKRALEKLAEACSAACRPIDDMRGTADYRTRVAGVMASRAAKIAFKRAGGKR
jgi:carbon-monoxide dehydrogenase medium subunit